jgi:hypothetical protein
VSILFTDLVGSTELGQQLGDHAADEVRRAHFQLLRSAITATGGTEVKTIGDAVMASYGSAADAVEGAVAMQQAVARQGRLDGRPLQMRVGISAGDATFESTTGSARRWSRRPGCAAPAERPDPGDRRGAGAGRFAVRPPAGTGRRDRGKGLARRCERVRWCGNRRPNNVTTD